MSDNKLLKFQILGLDAILLDGRVEVSAPDEDIGSKIMIKFGTAILDKKIKSLRINLPNKIVFITAQDKDHVLVRAEYCDDKKVMN
jgi:hypothetical protein